MTITVNSNPVRISAGTPVARDTGGGALTEAVRVALLQIASKVCYIDDRGQAYYQALYDALYTHVDPDELGVWTGGSY